MFFNMKSIAIYGLMAIAHASPIPAARSQAGELTSGASDATATSPTPALTQGLSDLDTRTKKKKVGSATCGDVTLSKDAVGNAFKECKARDEDYTVGNYPHYFGNQSGGGDVFTGVTKDLREFPIIEGGTYTAAGKLSSMLRRAPCPFMLALRSSSS